MTNDTITPSSASIDTVSAAPAVDSIPSSAGNDTVAAPVPAPIISNLPQPADDIHVSHGYFRMKLKEIEDFFKGEITKLEAEVKTLKSKL